MYVYTTKRYEKFDSSRMKEYVPQNSESLKLYDLCILIGKDPVDAMVEVLKCYYDIDIDKG